MLIIKKNKDGKMVEPHVDKDDIYTVFLTLGKVDSGGGNFFFTVLMINLNSKKVHMRITIFTWDRWTVLNTELMHGGVKGLHFLFIVPRLC